MIFHCLYFNLRFKFQHSFCNGCQNLTIISVNIRNITIITIKRVDYCCIILDNLPFGQFSQSKKKKCKLKFFQ